MSRRDTFITVADKSLSTGAKNSLIGEMKQSCTRESVCLCHSDGTFGSFISRYLLSPCFGNFLNLCCARSTRVSIFNPQRRKVKYSLHESAVKGRGFSSAPRLAEDQRGRRNSFTSPASPTSGFSSRTDYIRPVSARVLPFSPEKDNFIIWKNLERKKILGNVVI